MNKDNPVDDVQCLQDIGHRWRLNLKQEDNETKLKELADTRDSRVPLEKAPLTSPCVSSKITTFWAIMFVSMLFKVFKAMFF